MSGSNSGPEVSLQEASSGHPSDESIDSAYQSDESTDSERSLGLYLLLALIALIVIAWIVSFVLSNVVPGLT